MDAINEKLIRQVGHRGAMAVRIALLLGTMVVCFFVGYNAGGTTTGGTGTTTVATTATTTVAPTTTTCWLCNILVVHSPIWEYDLDSDFERLFLGDGTSPNNSIQHYPTHVSAINIDDDVKQLTAFTPAPLITDAAEFWSINNDGTVNDAAVGADYATGHSYCSLVHEDQLYILGSNVYMNYAALNHQISRIENCQLTRLGELPFNGKNIICTSTPNGYVVGFGGEEYYTGIPDTYNLKRRSWRGYSPLELDTELPMTTERHLQGAIASSQTHLIVMGGSELSDDSPNQVATEILDLSTWTWSSGQNFPYAYTPNEDDKWGDTNVYDGQMIYFTATDEFLFMGGYLGAIHTYPNRHIYGYSLPDDEWSVKGMMASRRTGAFSVRILDDYWLHIIGGRQAVRTSELCVRKMDYDGYGNSTSWGDDWRCEFTNTVTSSPNDLEYVFGYTHTMDVDADYCMN